MKKAFAFLAVIILSVSYLQAQVKVNYGIRGGLNVANWQGESVQSLGNLLAVTNGSVSTSSRFGFHAGGYAAIRLGERFVLEPGLQYSLKGAVLNGRLNGNSAVVDFLNVNAIFRVQSHYIELPVLAKVYITEGFHVFAGPQVGYLVKNDLRIQANTLGFSVINRNEDITNGFQKWDVGFVGGLGYRFDNGVNMMAAYDYGVQRIDENKRFATFNRAFKFSLGYEF